LLGLADRIKLWISKYLSFIQPGHQRLRDNNKIGEGVAVECIGVYGAWDLPLRLGDWGC
jgi:hypothetical protein